MKILMSLLLLFVVIIKVVNFAEGQCTPEKIRGCCVRKCKNPYCDSVIGSCECGNAQSNKDQCSINEDKCPTIKAYECCSRRCKYPYCDPKTGRCGCGDNKLTFNQCSANG